LIRTGNRLGAVDTLVAGISLYHNDALLTRNVQDFQKVHGLVVKGY